MGQENKQGHVLVTGGAGYIGSHTCKALAKAGWIPVTYDNLSTGHAYAVKWGPFVQGDLSDKVRLIETFRTYRPVAVLHFAGSALVVESVRDPSSYYQNNVAATLSLLDAMCAERVFHLVFSSSCAVYGDQGLPFLTEDLPKSPINPYGRTKWMVEQILADYYRAYGLASLSLRYFNAAGADLEGEVGENHTPETHLIPSILFAALKIRSEVILYGQDFPTPDGSAVRDYIHVRDLAEGHVAALEWILKNKKTEAINLGTGLGISTLEMVAAAEKVVGHLIPKRIEKRRAGEPASLLANPEKARKLLNWSPRYSDAETMISSAWRWHQILLTASPLLENALKRLIPESDTKNVAP